MSFMLIRLKVLLLFLLVAFLNFAFASGPSVSSGNLLESEPLLLKEIGPYTGWPAKDDRTEYIEINEEDLPYSQEIFFTEIFNPELLAKDWQQKQIRTKSIKEVGRIADAYLYRKKYEGGLLHICDTRQILTVCYYHPEIIFLDRPGEHLKALSAKLFKLSVPDNLQKRQSFYNVSKDYIGTPPPQGNPSYIGAKSTYPGSSTFRLTVCIGQNVIVYYITKGYVPDCMLDNRWPLFVDVNAKPTKEEITFKTVREKLAKFETPKAKDIPELLEMIEQMPDPPSQQQYNADPYRYRDRGVGYEVYLKLVAAVESIQAGGSEEVKMIRKALTLEDYLQNTDENPSRSWIRKIKRTSVGALCRINTDQAAVLHFEILGGEKERDQFNGLFGGLEMYPLFMESIEKDYDQAEAQGKHISNYEIYQNLRSRLEKQGSIPPIEKHASNTSVKRWSLLIVISVIVLVVIATMLIRKRAK